MRVKKLTETSFDELLDCFLLAFENYYVKMPSERSYYQERWKASKLNFNFSYGMFDGEKLVGFVIHSIDKRGGQLTAYNSGTGVIPEYRGNKVIQSIYHYALNYLEQNNIQKSVLEVITKNEKAIRAYESIGFVKTKNYKCFKGTIKTENFESFDLEKFDLKNFNWDLLPNQNRYSWDHQKESVIEGNYTLYQVSYNGKAESYFIIKPESGYVAQFDVLSSNNHVWNRLFAAIQTVSTTITVNNVDERLTEKIKQLEKVGLENIIDQYEMELIIKGDNNCLN